MFEKSFIEKSRLALYVLLTVTGVLYGSNLKFTKAPFLNPLVTMGAKKAEAATLSVDMWWPTNGAQVQGVQPFKGLLENTPVDQYTMYWKVDNGNLVPMNTNTTDYPHKEASVDITGWTWKGNGPYTITFVAKDTSGNELAEQSATIYNSAVAPTQTASPTPTLTTTNNTNTTSVTSPAVSTTSTTASVTTSVSTTTTTAPVQTITTSSSVTAPTITSSVNVWWPTNNAVVTGSQPFKAVVDGMTLNQYSMYWQVDGGSLNVMNDNQTDYPHKEAQVDLSGWNWKGSGPYVLTFVAKNTSGQTIATKNVTIYTGSTNTATTPTSPTATTPSGSGNPLSGLKLYVDPNSAAAQQVQSWLSSQPTNAAEINKIASQSQGIWLGGWSDVYTVTHNAIQAASAQGTVPLFIAYNIPERDCGSYSSGGASSASAYQSWIQSMASGIGNGKAIVILEPDAVAGITCLSQADQNTRYSLLQYAVTTLKKNPGTKVYVDAGNSHWVSANDMAGRLQQAGINQADGFSLNVSNYYTTDDNVSFGTTLAQLMNNKHFVIDTSRNGLGSNGQWCNPDGRALGAKPTTSTGNNLVDAYVWAKDPGESDGSCNGGPSAGIWWSDYALGLAERAAY